jgi:two-component system cell cycle sensor histidine kinase/response regulator CckA
MVDMAAKGARDSSDIARAAAYVYDDTLPATSSMLAGLLTGTEFHQLFESYYSLIGIPVAIIDLRANVLLSSRWQRICTEFHRVHPATCSRCVESDKNITSQLESGQNYVLRTCENGLTDCASPIILEGTHVANVFIGQFLTQAPDEERFRCQAELYGFDVSAYLAALREVPIVSPDRIPVILDLLSRMTRLVTNLSVARLRASEAQARLSIILNTIPQSVFWKDRDGRYLGCNKAFAEAAGLASPEELVGKNDHDLPWRESAEAYRADDRAVSESNRPRLHIIEPLQKADGSRAVIETSKVPFTDAAGTPRGVLGIYRDVTQELATQERFRTAFMTGLDAFYIATLEEGRCTEANDAFVRMFGYDRAEIIGKTSLDLHLYEDPTVRARLVVELGEKGFVRDVEVWGRKKNGERILVSLSIRIMRMDEKPHIMGVLRDVTAREVARKEKERLEAQLRQAQKMEALGVLAGGVAHDFNNVLAIILSYSSMLMDDLNPADPMRADLAEIKGAGERAAHLTRQLLAFGRKQLLEPRVVDLNDIVGGLTKMLQRLIGEDINLVTRPASDPVWLQVDPSQIEQVLMNLSVNARDAMPTGGTLTIEIKRSDLDEDQMRRAGLQAGRHVELSVTDTGVGMDRATQARIFEPFFTTKPTGKGTGLGLSTVFGIAKQSGGQVTVESEPGKGATFRIWLPLAAKAETQPETVCAAPEDGPRNARTILLVEDDDCVRKVAQAILSKKGYTVLEARSGGDALVLCEQHRGPIDLVLTDVVMPLMNGDELFRRLGRIRPGLRVVFMSGYTNKVASQNELVATASGGFLAKPFTPEKLLRSVREALEKDRRGDSADLAHGPADR